MDIFYIVVLSIAIILLILLLTVVGLMMKNKNRIDVYPPFQSQCPDYWGVNTDGTCNPNTTINRLPNSYNPKPSDLKKIRIDIPGGNVHDFSGNSLCDNKKWATQYSIEWDGVSNSIVKC